MTAPRITGITAMVAVAAEAARTGQSGTWECPHYSASTERQPVEPTETLFVLRHYGTPILYARLDGTGQGFESWLGAGWWGSATDCSAIAKAHRALGMRKHIRRGVLVADAPRIEPVARTEPAALAKCAECGESESAIPSFRGTHKYGPMAHPFVSAER
jgi:hypothetical protein